MSTIEPTSGRPDTPKPGPRHRAIPAPAPARDILDVTPVCRICRTVLRRPGNAVTIDAADTCVWAYCHRCRMAVSQNVARTDIAVWVGAGADFIPQGVDDATDAAEWDARVWGPAAPTFDEYVDLLDGAA